MSHRKARSRAAAPSSRSSRSASSGGGGRGRLVLVAALVVAGAAGAWWFLGRPGLPGRADGPADREKVIARMLEGEVLVFDLNPSLRKLSKGVTNLKLPDAKARGVFAAKVKASDLGAEGPAAASYVATGLGARKGEWPLGRGSASVERERLALWEPFFARVDYWDWSKFYFQNAKYVDEAKTRFTSEVGFKGRARLKEGGFCGVEAHQTVLWQAGEPDTSGKPTWSIVEWKQRDFHLLEAERLPFEDVLATALPDPMARARAAISLHDRHVFNMITDLRKPPDQRTTGPPHKYFFPASHDHHPAVSIVDIDRDGWDDVYLSVQWGPNQLFRNRGDGTFEEVAARWGLDVPEHSSGSAFADFDNDGDADVIVGRTLSRSVYLANEGGRYVDRSGEWTGGELPSLVSSVTVADYDGDGLLDAYFGTYASDLMRSAGNVQPGGAVQPGSDPGSLFLREFLTPTEASELEAHYRKPDYHAFKNAAGPPNVLLRNAGGGRFARVDDTPLRVFRHTYQATFGDYDNDGDPDVFLANDFSKNNLFRNDGGKFVDVTNETGTSDVGFGMGATWGDYDRDGRQDLYVTKMYSKAGNRILAQLPWIDPDFKEMARGNTLFRNAASGPWTKVSGTTPGTMQVEYAEWAWASQFVDLDNDGWLDLHSPNGHYTPPREVQAEVDL
jgi:hypothetical protein